MTNLQTAAQQALDAFENAIEDHDDPKWHPVGHSLAALRAALAEPVQEPVAWMVYTLDGKSVCVTDNPNDFTPEHRALPLYTAPPRCSNCASLEAQNTELDRKLAELEGKPPCAIGDCIPGKCNICKVDI